MDVNTLARRVPQKKDKVMSTKDDDFTRSFKLILAEKKRRAEEQAKTVQAITNLLEHEDPSYHEPVDWDNLFNETFTINNEVKPTRKK